MKEEADHTKRVRTFERLKEEYEETLNRHDVSLNTNTKGKHLHLIFTVLLFITHINFNSLSIVIF